MEKKDIEKKSMEKKNAVTQLPLKMGKLSPIEFAITEGSILIENDRVAEMLSKYALLRKISTERSTSEEKDLLSHQMTITSMATTLGIAHLEHLFWHFLVKRKSEYFYSLGQSLDSDPKGHYALSGTGKLVPMRLKKVKDFYKNKLPTLFSGKEKMPEEFFTTVEEDIIQIRHFVLQHIQKYYNEKQDAVSEDKIIRFMSAKQETNEQFSDADLEEIIRVVAKIFKTKFNLIRHQNGDVIKKCFYGESLFEEKIPAPTIYTNGKIWAFFYSSNNPFMKKIWEKSSKLILSISTKVSLTPETQCRVEQFYGSRAFQSRNQYLIQQTFQVIHELYGGIII